MADDIFSETDEFMEEVMNDPESQREMQRKIEEWETQRLDIISRPQSGPEALTDGEILNLIGKGFDLFCEVPFGNHYDHLIERLAFTHKKLETDDAGKLKTAWTSFLNEVDVAFGWPLSEGMAGWYEEREMYAHATAVYEHLYTLVRRGELGHGDFDQRSDSNESSFLETWLIHLVKLYSRQKQSERARHFCELIDDYSDDGYVSPVGSAEAISWKDELSRAAMNPRFQADLDLARDTLKHEFDRFDDLHNMTKEFVVGAELWSNNPWININPWIIPLRWAQAIESEFHHKVFMPNRHQIKDLLGDDKLRECTLGQIMKVLKKEVSDVGLLSEILAAMCNSEFLASQDTLDKLDIVRIARNRVAHGSKKKTYALEDGHDFLRKIRETNWAFRFLDALQPKSSSAHN